MQKAYFLFDNFFLISISYVTLGEISIILLYLNKKIFFLLYTCVYIFSSILFFICAQYNCIFKINLGNIIHTFIQYKKIPTSI